MLALENLFLFSFLLQHLIILILFSVLEAPSHLSSLLEARRARLEAPTEVTVV